MTDGIDVYWLPYCTTCQKAVAYLQEKAVPVRGYRNLKEQPLSEDEVRALARRSAAWRRCSPGARRSIGSWACTSGSFRTTTSCG